MKKFQNKNFIFVFKVAHLEVISRICVKNRIKNDRLFFWNSCSFFFILWMRKSRRKRSGEIKKISVILNFPNPSKFSVRILLDYFFRFFFFTNFKNASFPLRFSILWTGFRNMSKWSGQLWFRTLDSIKRIT